FEVIQPPTTPSQAISPNKGKIIVMGTLGGLAFGIGMVLLLGFLDPATRTVSDLEALTDLPVIGALPRWKSEDEKRNAIDASASETSDNTPAMEAIRTLRAGLTFLGDTKERCSFVITSAVASEGKSWVASNLALSFAKQG